MDERTIEALASGEPDPHTLPSPRPWTYHSAPSNNAPGQNRDWIEDASGRVILENVGYRDGPLICRCVNAIYDTAALQKDGERLARTFHITYEALAPLYNYETRKASRVEWEAVPEANRLLMIAVAKQLLLNRVVTLRDDLRADRNFGS